MATNGVSCLQGQVKVINTNDLGIVKAKIQNRMPFIVRGLNFGECCKKWTVDYLSKVLDETEVRVHVSPVAKMDFIKKNFQYKTLEFKEFLKRICGESEEHFICPNEKYYLRSLGNDPRKDISDLKKQLPQLQNDFIIPDVFDKDRYFSSVFRISSPCVQLWTHYDIMDNILMHVKGHKRVVLFPPTDLLNLYMIGDKSQILDIDHPDFDHYPKFQDVQRTECILEPGDVLFIPALWFHNVTAIDFSISINVFWKHLKDDAYDQKDVYGNKDLVPAQKAIQGVEKALKTLSTLPNDYREFFARRLISKIESTLTE